jgi:hypothetical protein
MAIAAALVPVARTAGQAVLAAAPEIKQKALEYISKATNGRISTPAQVTQFASSGKNALAIVASGAVRAGIPADQVLNRAVIDRIGDQDLATLHGNLRSEFNAVYGRIDAESKFLSPAQRQTAQDLMAKDVIQFIRRARLGGNIREAHVKLRLFMAMSEDEISRAIALGWDKE